LKYSGPKQKKINSGYTAYVDSGLRFALSIVIGAGGGYWLDMKINTKPVFLILGLILGVTSGFLALYRSVYPLDKESKDSE